MLSKDLVRSAGVKIYYFIALVCTFFLMSQIWRLVALPVAGVLELDDPWGPFQRGHFMNGEHSNFCGVNRILKPGAAQSRKVRPCFIKP